MAKNEIRNGQAEYGTIHIMEEEQRKAGHGVYEAKSNGAAPSNKMAEPSDNKADEPSMSMTKAELVDAAEADGVKLDGNETKSDLIAKIEKARK